MKPTILVANSNADRVCQGRNLWTCVCGTKFKTVDEVIKLANDSDYGLGGAVFSSNITALKVAPQRTHRPYVGQHLQ